MCVNDSSLRWNAPSVLTCLRCYNKYTGPSPPAAADVSAVAILNRRSSKLISISARSLGYTVRLQERPTSSYPAVNCCTAPEKFPFCHTQSFVITNIGFLFTSCLSLFCFSFRFSAPWKEAGPIRTFTTTENVTIYIYINYLM